MAGFSEHDNDLRDLLSVWQFLKKEYLSANWSAEEA
jgi:hypothetical protein